MTKLWFLLLLLHEVTARKLTKEENEELKGKCSVMQSVHLRVKRRQPVSNSEYPFAAALCHRRVVHLSGEEIQQRSTPICSGVLISPRHILTAAHCLYANYIPSCTHGLRPPRLSAQNVGIFLSSRCAKSECWFKEKMLKPTSVVMHPNYQDCMRNGTYDIGVIELNEDVNIVPICMPEANSIISNHEKLEFIGYGNVDGQQSLQSVSYQHIMEGKEIFVYNMTLENEIAPGDSGGPLVQKVEGKHYLFGIQAGDGQRIHYEGEQKIPVGEGAIYADVRKHLKWICDVTGVCPLSYSTNQCSQPRTSTISATTTSNDGND